MVCSARCWHRALAVTLLLSVLALALVPALAVAAPTTLAAKQAEADRVRAQMESASRALASRLAAYQKLAISARSARLEADRLSADLRRKQAALAIDQARLDAAATGMYTGGRIDFLTVVFGARSISELESGLDYLTRFSEADAKLVASIRAQKAAAESTHTKLRARQRRLEALTKSAAAQIAQVRRSMAQQQASYDALSSDITDLLKPPPRPPAPVVPKTKKPYHGRVTPRGRGWLNGTWLGAGGYAHITGRSSAYLVPASQTKSYHSTGQSFDWITSEYGGGGGTASGRPFNEDELTCAHKTLPFGTLLAVSRGSRHIIVVVTDRGPYIKGRSLDVSNAAGRALGIDGVGRVHVEIVLPGS